MASASVMLKRDQDIFLVPKQFEKRPNCDAFIQEMLQTDKPNSGDSSKSSKNFSKVS